MTEPPAQQQLKRAEGHAAETRTARAREYAGTFHGNPDQVRQARYQVAMHLAGCPAADDVIMIVSELATNAVLHSGSAGRHFTVRAELFRDYVRVECEDLGGQWQGKAGQDRPHGLSIISALAGRDNWGIDGDSTGRVVWARLAW
jgi:hypothetical protein